VRSSSVAHRHCATASMASQNLARAARGDCSCVGWSGPSGNAWKYF